MSATPVSEQTRTVKRPARRDLRDTGKMKVPEIPGYYVRFINTDSRNHPTRLQDYKDNWFEPVLRSELYGKDCDRPNEPHTIGDPLEPMLVKLPKDIHDEDVRKKQRMDDAIVQNRVHAKEQNQYGNVSLSDTL